MIKNDYEEFLEIVSANKIQIIAVQMPAVETYLLEFELVPFWFEVLFKDGKFVYSHIKPEQFRGDFIPYAPFKKLHKGTNVEIKKTYDFEHFIKIVKRYAVGQKEILLTFGLGATL